MPHRHGAYYAHKPPLMFWLINAGATLTGGDINRVATRLPSLLGAILSLWAIAGLARHWSATAPPAQVEATALRAVMVLLTTFMFWNKGGMGQIDSLLCGLELFAIYHLVAYESDRHTWRPLLAYAAMGLAILAKGPVGIVVPFGMYLASVFAARDGQHRRFAHLAWGPWLVILFPAAWLSWVYLHHPPPGFIDELLFKQNVGRASGELGHLKPFYYYLEYFPLFFLPWTALWFFLPRTYREGTERVALRRLLAMVAFVVLFFSLSPSKRELYILPAYPPMALAVALCWPALARHTGKALIRFWTGLLGIGGLVAIGAVIVNGFKPMLPFPGTPLLIPGAVALLGALWLRARYRRERTYTDPVLLGFAGIMLALQMAIGAFVYPAINTLKATYAVAAAANAFLAPDEPLHLYRMNGEIMALYARRPGCSFKDPASLEHDLRQRGHGLVVLEQKSWPSLAESLTAGAVRQNFRMGHKEMIWIHVDFRGRQDS